MRGRALREATAAVPLPFLWGVGVRKEGAAVKPSKPRHGAKPAADGVCTRKPPYDKLSDVVAGRVQAGPPPTPPRDEVDLDHWQDLDYFHAPEL